MLGNLLLVFLALICSLRQPGFLHFRGYTLLHFFTTESRERRICFFTFFSFLFLYSFSLFPLPSSLVVPPLSLPMFSTQLLSEIKTSKAICSLGPVPILLVFLFSLLAPQIPLCLLSVSSSLLFFTLPVSLYCS